MLVQRLEMVVKAQAQWLNAGESTTAAVHRQSHNNGWSFTSLPMWQCLKVCEGQTCSTSRSRIQLRNKLVDDTT